MTVLRSGSATDVGRVRTVNEDLALESLTLFAVADGMGGHAGGEIAARTAIDALRAAFGRAASVDGLVGAVEQANEAVWERGRAEAALRGMGTTLIAAALVDTADGDRLALANVGDSRAYRFHRSRLSQLTTDHSVAEELVARGELTAAEAAVHPQRHILTRALGVSPDVDVDVWELVPEEGDRFLLCSDGLTNEVPEDRITEVLAATRDPRAAAETLVRMANRAGGNDNCTVVVLDVVVGEHPAAQDTDTGVPAVAPLGAVPAAGGPGPGAGAPGTPGPSGGAAPAPPSPGTATALAPPPAARPPAVPVPATAAPGVTAPGVTAPGVAVPGVEIPGVGAPGSAAPPTAAPPTVSPITAAPEAGAANGSGTAVVGRSSMPSRGARAPRHHHQAVRPPRRVTFRVVLFVVLLGGVVYAGYSVIRWYVNSSYYVSLDHQNVVIYQGRRGGFVGIKPRIVKRYALTTAQVPSFDLGALRSGVEEPSLQAATTYVSNLVNEPCSLEGAPASCSTTTTAPVGSTSTSTSTTRALARVAVVGAPSAAVGGA